ncbi:lignostilbene alpha-beta-dioxygenase [Halieaceae bacterium IMCC14734]|uniref:Lignostilbene alpha-beta-dioxygenase n=1 Tax=Candidatus Litorirhabdus singularis TaxID=2518993 RepID=A0ABT3TJ88_9GAMM|nr:carotenoid oxygenase family protein [Candidatus Litorirhabdus singularis]MCX2982392.1 lignostilbene alpha-beta-dioxygenase [Candidatus Litorirhabdus singularis]
MNAPNTVAARIKPGCHIAGYEALSEEHDYTVDADTITGQVPEELVGTLFRNGPGRLKIGPYKYGHWFDGDGMLSAISFDRGQVHYRNRYVRTPKYVNETAAQKILYRGVGTQRPGGFLNNMFRFPGNAANTAVVYHGDRLLALWEGGAPWELNPADLTTVGAHNFSGQLKMGMPFSAHGKVHPGTGNYYNFGMMGALNFYKIDPHGEMVGRTRHKVGNYAMCHDFAMTDKYAVFFLCPAVFKTPLKFVLGMHSIVDAMAYDPSLPTKVVVLSLDDLSLVREFEVDPFFCYHFGNAYEDGDEINVDVCRVDEMGSMDAMRDVFADIEVEPDPSACFYRFKLNLASGEVSGYRHEGVQGGDFPVWDQRRTGVEHRYSYTATVLENGTPYTFNALQKIDHQTGVVSFFDFGPGRFTSEALFIPRPGGTAEDDGWLAAVLFNADTGRSEVSLVDAVAMSDEIASIPLLHHVPYGFHGFYTPHIFSDN